MARTSSGPDSAPFPFPLPRPIEHGGNIEPSSLTQGSSSPKPPLSVPLPRPVRRGGHLIFTAKGEVSDQVNIRLIPPRNPSPSPEERSAMMKDALERKKTAVFLLADAQKDVEIQASYMIEERGLAETIRFYDVHYQIEDQSTAIGKFVKAASRLTITPPVGNGQDANHAQRA